MKTKAVVASAVVLLLFVITLVFLHRQQTPDFVVRHFKRNVWPGTAITETFVITNQGTKECFVYPNGLESFDGTNWKAVSRTPFPAAGGFSLAPNKGKFYTFENASDLPTGRPLRLKMAVGWELKGLSGVLPRFMLRFRYKSNVPLNPFDKSSKVFSQTIETFSDEFTEPIPHDE